MTITETLKTLVDQMPDPDDRNMYTKNIDKEKIDTAVAAIFQGGRENVQGLIEMLGEPGSEEDVKPHYALHCVLNHALITKDEKARRDFAVTLAQNLTRDLSPYHKAYLCQELQWMGREESVESLGRLLLDEELAEPAAMALVAIKTGAPVVLRNALPEARGKCRLNIVHALAALGDAGAEGEFKAALQDQDPEVRIAARAGLAKIATPDGVQSLLQSVEATAGWERTQAAKSCLVAAENLAAGGDPKAARRVYDRVVEVFAQDTDAHVREAAALGKTRLPADKS